MPDIVKANLSTPCPCGSGNPFADCHGRGSPTVANPLIIDPGVPTRKLDLACGQNVRDGYEGVDRHSSAQHVVNLFKFPWPWPDSSVAEINCSHFIEHIPMIEVDEVGTPVPFGEGVDLFFRFFDEIFRVLVPGGWAHIVTPCARNDRAFQDPTHRRFIVAQTFLYLAKEWRDINKLDHYGVQCDFGVSANPTVAVELTTRNQHAAQRLMQHEWNHIADWVAELQSKKVVATGSGITGSGITKIRPGGFDVPFK